MRRLLPPAPVSALAVLALACGLCPAGAAEEPGKPQTRPGWVDPPAKTPAMKDAKGAATDVPKADTASAPPSPAAAAPDATETPPASRVAERRSRRYAVRRAAPRPSTPSVIASTAPVSDGQLRAWAGTAQALARDYLDSVSAPGPAMLAATPRFYGERVLFHGRSMTLAALTAEKRRFVQRWPERRYEPRSDSIRTACSPTQALCRVEALFDFRAENPAKGLRSQGVSSVTFEISLAGPRPVIVSETSRVLRRDGPVSAVPASRRPA